MTIEIEEMDFKQILDIIKYKLENENSCFVDLYKSLKISQKKHIQLIIEAKEESIYEIEQQVVGLNNNKQDLLNTLKLQKTELNKYNKQLKVIDDLYGR